MVVRKAAARDDATAVFFERREELLRPADPGEGDDRPAGDILAPLRRHEARPQQRSSRRERSEEHTSELQSLMRISYAVFCLKKKNHPLAWYTYYRSFIA